VEAGLIPANPIKGYKTPKQNARVTYITPEQESALIAAARRKRFTETRRNSRRLFFTLEELCDRLRLGRTSLRIAGRQGLKVGRLGQHCHVQRNGTQALELLDGTARMSPAAMRKWSQPVTAFFGSRGFFCSLTTYCNPIAKRYQIRNKGIAVN
jgi:hypothetical protein